MKTNLNKVIKSEWLKSWGELRVNSEQLSVIKRGVNYDV